MQVVEDVFKYAGNSQAGSVCHILQAGSLRYNITSWNIYIIFCRIEDVSVHPCAET